MHSVLPRLLAPALVFFLPFHPASGQTWEPGTAPSSPQEIRLHVPRVAVGPPMDPSLTHPLWETAARLDHWTQTTPGDNAPPMAPTVALLLHDDDALYIGIHAYDEPGAVRYAMHRRDVVLRQAQDYIGLHLDPFNDRRQTFYFAVNPVGIQGDGIFLESTGAFVPWDGIFDTSGEVDPEGGGYRAVFRIPFKTLRFRPADPQVWGVSLTRRYGRNEAEDTPWTLDRNLACDFCQMGEIVLEGVTPGRNLEVNPALVANTSANRPFPQEPMSSLQGGFEPSVNVKYGLTSNITADATLNPDFSQVESDAGQLEVNNRFALFFRESRPFFNEGADLFVTGISLPRFQGGGGGSAPLNLFHSRTIVEPDWGAKISGKAGKMGVGLVAAGDAASPVDLAGAQGGSRAGVGRLTWDVGDDGYVGAMVTHRDHRGAGDQVGAMDTRIRVTDNLSFRGMLVASRFSSPWNGFQPAQTPTERPLPIPSDSPDPVIGKALQLQTNYQSRSWAGGLGLLDITPDFRAPLGFVPRNDQLLLAGAWAWIWRGTGFIRRFQPGITVERIHEHGESGNLLDGDRLTDQLWETGVVMDLAGASQFQLRYSRSSTLFREQLFPNQDRLNLSLRSNAFARAGLETSLEVGEAVIFQDRTGGGSPLPGWVVEGNLSSTLRPHTSVRLDVGARGSRIWRRSETSARESHYADALIPRLRSEVQFTPRLGFRGIAEYRGQSFFGPGGAKVDQDQEILLDILFSYVINYGSAFYVGWTELHVGDELRSPVPTRRGGVAKATYVWRF
ncbi:MAG: DUF5916 domain-containing protein [Gemmatimonadota bacterium]